MNWTDEEMQRYLDALVHEEPLLKLFRFLHLREPLRGISRMFADIAYGIVANQEKNPERDECLRHLRRAKDCAVTAYLWDED